MKSVVVLLVVLLAGVSRFTYAAPVIVDPSAYSSGTDLGTPAPGVVLSTGQGYVDFVDFDQTPTLVETIRLTGPAVGSVYAAGPFFASASFPNWASDPQFGRYEVFVATFSVPIDFVSMTFHPDDTDTGVLGVFDASGALLSHQYLRQSGSFELSYAFQGTPIAYILAGFSDPARLGALEFNVSAVPEPGTLVLVVAACLAAGVWRRPSPVAAPRRVSGRISRRVKALPAN